MNLLQKNGFKRKTIAQYCMLLRATTWTTWNTSWTVEQMIGTWIHIYIYIYHLSWLFYSFSVQIPQKKKKTNEHYWPLFQSKLFRCNKFGEMRTANTRSLHRSILIHPYYMAFSCLFQLLQKSNIIPCYPQKSKKIKNNSKLPNSNMFYLQKKHMLCASNSLMLTLLDLSLSLQRLHENHWVGCWDFTRFYYQKTGCVRVFPANCSINNWTQCIFIFIASRFDFNTSTYFNHFCTQLLLNLNKQKHEWSQMPRCNFVENTLEGAQLSLVPFHLFHNCDVLRAKLVQRQAHRRPTRWYWHCMKLVRLVFVLGNHRL